MLSGFEDNFSNTVIVAHRNRRQQLQYFLQSFLGASPEKYFTTLIICDTGSTDGSRFEFDSLCSGKGYRWIQVSDDGLFNKSKALNTCLKEVKTNLVTMLDVDSIISPNFFEYIYNHFCKNSDTKKLCHRVRYFSATPNKINHISISRRIRLYKVSGERFFVNGKFLWFANIHQRHKTNELYKSFAIGNSHFTSYTKFVRDIGGWNFEFSGWGFEDLEFSDRFWSRYQSGTVDMKTNYYIVHVPHAKKSGWNVDNRHNEEKYIKCSNNGYPLPDINDINWCYNV